MSIPTGGPCDEVTIVVDDLSGSGDFFQPARSLYEKFGFSYCGPFADYRPSPDNVFMTRTI